MMTTVTQMSRRCTYIQLQQPSIILRQMQPQMLPSRSQLFHSTYINAALVAVADAAAAHAAAAAATDPYISSFCSVHRIDLWRTSSRRPTGPAQSWNYLIPIN